MPYYETVFITRQDLTDKQVEELTSQMSKIITDAKGKIHKTEQWGLKSFAYRINKARKGHYTLLEIESEAAAVQEMERQMRLHEDVVRYLTIREDELSDGPSIMMRKDRDERDDYKKSEDKSDDKKEAA